MHNPENGNRIIFIAFAMIVAAITLFIPWGVISLSPGMVSDLTVTVIEAQSPLGKSRAALSNETASPPSFVNVPITGLNGRLALGVLRTPYWVGVAMVLSGLLFTITNIIRFSEVPKPLVNILLGSGFVVPIWASINILGAGRIELGVLLLMSASAVGFIQGREVPAAAGVRESIAP